LKKERKGKKERKKREEEKKVNPTKYEHSTIKRFERNEPQNSKKIKIKKDKAQVQIP